MDESKNVVFKLSERQAFSYERPAIHQGYTGQTLAVDLTSEIIATQAVSPEMKSKFVGGKGFDLRLLWDAVRSDTKWDHPENAICIASGPMGGTPGYPGSGKSIVTTISPLTGIPIDSNVGGYFGPYLKFSGFDALAITGKSDYESVLLIDGIESRVRVFQVTGLPDDSYEISHLLTEYFSQGKPAQISVVSTGQGARHTRLGCLNFTWYDTKRKRARYKQAGRGGIGTVFADKRIKAVVARWDRVPLDINKPADKETYRSVAKAYSKEIVELDPKQNEMARLGTTHLVPIMNDHDCLPVNNFRFGQHHQAGLIGRDAYGQLFDPGFDGCWKGCTVACSHGIKEFVPLSGPYQGQKVFVDGPEYETIAGCGSNLGIFDPFTIAEMNFYCDNYGLDTISVGTSLSFVMECFELGLIDTSHTDGIDLSFGNRQGALELLHQMGRG